MLAAVEKSKQQSCVPGREVRLGSNFYLNWARVVRKQLWVNEPSVLDAPFSVVPGQLIIVSRSE